METSDPRPPSNSAGNLPSRIGRFEVRGLVGQGAFGKVYRAHDPQLRREVAVKVAQPGTLSDLRQLMRFLREARAAAALHHPNIVPVLDAGEDGGHPYMATAFVEGPTLAERLTQGPLPFAEAAQIIRDLAEALDHAHGQGVLHRDVKPANVILDRDGRPNLLDFGLAYRQDHGAELTHDGEVLGTPAYLAPEIATGRIGEPLAASDQYSLGVILFEMLCSQLPFAHLAQALASPSPRPRRLNRQVPAPLETICLKALARQPDERYPSCQALADDLRRFLSHRPVYARRPGLVERFGLWRQREPALAWSAVAAGLALLTVAVVPLVAFLLLSASLRHQEEARKKYEEQEAKAKSDTLEAERHQEAAHRESLAARKAIEEAEAEKGKAAEARLTALAETEKARKATEDVVRRELQRQRYQYVAEFNLAQIQEDGPDWAKRLDPFIPGLELSLLRRQRSMIPQRLPELQFPIEALDYSRLKIGPVAFGKDPKKKQFRAAQCEGDPIKGGSTVRLLDVSRYSVAMGQVLLKADLSTQTDVFECRGERVWKIKDHPPHLKIVAVSPGGDFLASTHEKPATIKLWKGDPPKEEASLNFAATAVAFARDSTMLAAGSISQPGQGAEIKIWDLPAGSERLKLTGHSRGTVRQLEFSPDSKLLASATDTDVLLWDLTTQKPRVTWDFPRCRLLLFAPDGKLFLTLSEGIPEGLQGNVRLCETATGKEVPLLAGDGLTQSAAFSPDSNLLALGARDGPTVTLRKAATGLRLLSLIVSGKQVAVAFSGADGQLAAGGEDGVIHLWSKAQYESPAILEGFPASVAALGFAGVKPVAAAGKAVYHFDPRDSAQPVTLAEHSAPITCLATVPGSPRLYFGSEDGAVKVWDVDTRTEKASLPAGSGPVRALTLSGDGQVLAVGYEDGVVLLWSAAEDREVRRFASGPGKLSALMLVPDGKQLLAAGPKFARLVNVATGKETADLFQELGEITALAVSPDGQRVAVVGPGGKASLWDLAERKERVALQPARPDVSSLLFTPDGKTLVTGGRDGVVRLWEVVTGQELLSFKGHAGPVVSLAFNPAAGLLVSGGADGVVRLWSGKETPRPPDAPPLLKP